MQHAVKNIDEKIAGVLQGENALEQIRIDRILKETDGTDNKSNRCQCHAGSVHGGVARAAAGGTQASVVPLLWRNLSETSAGTHDEYLKRRSMRRTPWISRSS
ncbi:MAG: hypothetical protein ACLR6I_18190 [Waltera sp.]